jgi:ABC-type protease/lipase transport system fused ATPase/permease subunit
LSQLRECENLFLYLGVADLTISTLLVREEGEIQHPVYYFSMMLQDVMTRYLKMEKVSLALISAFRKLKPYLQAHQVIVLIDQPFRLFFIGLIYQDV